MKHSKLYAVLTLMGLVALSATAGFSLSANNDDFAADVLGQSDDRPYEDGQYYEDCFEDDCRLGDDRPYEDGRYEDDCFDDDCRFGDDRFDDDRPYEDRRYEDDCFGEDCRFGDERFGDERPYEDGRYEDDCFDDDCRFGDDRFEDDCFEDNCRFDDDRFEDDCFEDNCRFDDDRFRDDCFEDDCRFDDDRFEDDRFKDERRYEDDKWDEDYNRYDKEEWDNDKWNNDHNLRFVDDMRREIDFIKTELNGVKILVEAVNDLNFDNARLQNAVDSLSRLEQKGSELLVKMKANIEGDQFDPKDMKKFWDILDELGHSAKDHTKNVFKYFDKHPADFLLLPADVQDLVRRWKNDGFEKEKGNDKFENFDDVYGQTVDQQFINDLSQKIREEIMEEVMRSVSTELMEKLAPHLGEEAVAEMLNNIDIFGDKGNDLLSNTAEVLAETDEISETGLTAGLRALLKRTKDTIFVSSVKNELAAKWNEVALAVESGDSAVLAGLEADIERLLATNEDLAVKGDEAYRFSDTPLDEWYYRSIMSMKESGYVSGYSDEQGNSTGEFGVGNNVTIAEVLKMALEAAGVDVLPQGGGGHWADSAGYVAAAKSLGIDALINIGDLNRTATREEVAVIVAETFGLDLSVPYAGVFSDYQGAFDRHIQAVYDAGVFTGDGTTGNFNGPAFINRAAMAKVISFAIEASRSDNFIEELGSLEL